MKIEQLKIGLKKTSDSGIFHDTRKDVRTLAKCVDMLENKINELVEQNNRLHDAFEEIIKKLKE